MSLSNEDGSLSGLYFGFGSEFDVIYELGTGRPVYYRDGDTYYRYSDGNHVYYAVTDASGRHLYRYDRGPSLHCPSLETLAAELFPELKDQIGNDQWRSQDGNQGPRTSSEWSQTLDVIRQNLRNRSQPRSKLHSMSWWRRIRNWWKATVR
jgi:hypothetical protein